MKTRKLGLIVLLTGGLLAVGPTGFAQDSGDGDRPRNRQERGPAGMTNIQERVQRVAEELKLTDEQRTKLKTALEAQGEKLRALRADESLTQEQRREKAMEIRAELNKQMKEILTEEQYKQWQQMRPRPAQGGPTPQRPARPEGATDGGDKKPDDQKPKDAAN